MRYDIVRGSQMHLSKLAIEKQLEAARAQLEAAVLTGDNKGATHLTDHIMQLTRQHCAAICDINRYLRDCMRGF